MLNGSRIEGLQHKYRETVLFFPKSGQTCHAYCAFCFRWPQFVEDSSMRMALADSNMLARYLGVHTEVTDLLITGGDPLTMSTRRLATYLDPLLGSGLEHVQNIRIGTKALSFWPFRFVSDDDADELLRLFERLIKAGRSVAVMAHFNHPVELSTPIVHRAISRILSTGAQIRSQSPLLRYVNDDPGVWSSMWKEQVRLGIYPYYMFIVRDTGARSRFDVPLVRALQVYRDAVINVSGLARTARGPSMSTNAGKIEIQGITTVEREDVFLLNFIQARNPAWVRQPFFAHFDEKATWFDDLKPAMGKDRFFFEAPAVD
jgi:KamA family protein